jgi:hypothetical protein
MSDLAINNVFGGLKKNKINNGQIMLYQLVCEKIKTKQTIQYQEIEDIYINHVQRSKSGACLVWDKEKKHYTWEKRNYDEADIQRLAESWVLRAIGTLIKKGYLTVVPVMNLRKKGLNDDSKPRSLRTS